MSVQASALDEPRELSRTEGPFTLPLNAPLGREHWLANPSCEWAYQARGGWRQ